MRRANSFLRRYVECDSQTVFENLVVLETKNLVQHLDHDNQQWTRVIVTAEEENTHSSFLFNHNG